MPVLATRLSLRLAEAAAALGISERKLREISSIPRVRVDGTVLIPTESLREWLRDAAETQDAKADQLADQIMKELGS